MVMLRSMSVIPGYVQVVGEALSLKGIAVDRLYIKGHGETTAFGSSAADNRRVTVAVFNGG